MYLALKSYMDIDICIIDNYIVALEWIISINRWMFTVRLLLGLRNWNLDWELLAVFNCYNRSGMEIKHVRCIMFWN